MRGKSAVAILRSRKADTPQSMLQLQDESGCCRLCHMLCEHPSSNLEWAGSRIQCTSSSIHSDISFSAKTTGRIPFCLFFSYYEHPDYTCFLEVDADVMRETWQLNQQVKSGWMFRRNCLITHHMSLEASFLLVVRFQKGFKNKLQHLPSVRLADFKIRLLEHPVQDFFTLRGREAGQNGT